MAVRGRAAQMKLDHAGAAMALRHRKEGRGGGTGKVVTL